MARTVIEDSPTVVEDTSGPTLGLIVGLLLGVAVVVLAVLFFAGTWDNNSNNSPSVPGTDTGPGASAPANNEPQPSSAPS